MRALLFDGTAVKFRQFHADPVWSPASDEALIQVRLAGLCQTDLEIAKGYMGFKGVLGHEFVGTVVQAAGPSGAALVGKRVVGEINCVCGKCDMCARGLSTHCRQRTVLGIQNRDGIFADFTLLPIRNLHVVPDNVSDEEAVFTEPLAAAVQILRQVQIDARTHVTVLGDGRLGQLVARVMALRHGPLLLVGRHAAKLALADRAGIRTALDREVEARRDQDLVIDCTGRAAGFSRALQFVRPRGTVVLKTTVADAPADASGPPLNLAPVVIDEITVLGSRCGPFREALAMLGQKQIDVTALISRRVKMDAAESLFAAPLAADTLKVLLTFDR